MTNKSLILTGEGAKGAWQAYAAVTHISVYGKPNRIYGISSGAINAVGIATIGTDIIKFWSDIKSIRDVFNFNPLFVFGKGLFKTKQLRKKLEKIADVTFKIPCTFLIASITSGKVRQVHIPIGARIGDYINEIIAAVAIPGLVEPIIINDDYYVDGGVRELCPLRTMLNNELPWDLSADTHIIPSEKANLTIISGRQLHDAPYMKAKITPISAAYRFLDLLMHQAIINDLNELRMVRNHFDVDVLMPAYPLPDALDFDQCRDMVSGRIGINRKIIKAF